MPTSFDTADQHAREREARLVLEEIDAANQDMLEKYTSVNGLELIEKMQERDPKCDGITEGQLEFLRQIRDRLAEKGAI